MIDFPGDNIQEEALIFYIISKSFSLLDFNFAIALLYATPMLMTLKLLIVLLTNSNLLHLTCQIVK